MYRLPSVPSESACGLVKFAARRRAAVAVVVGVERLAAGDGGDRAVGVEAAHARVAAVVAEVDLALRAGLDRQSAPQARVRAGMPS